MHRYKRWVIFTAVIFLLLSASLVNGLHLYQMAAILLVLPGVSYLIGMFALRDLTFSRKAPGSGWEGEIATFEIEVRSSARLPRLFVRASDQFPEWLRPVEAYPSIFNVPPRGVVTLPYQVELAKRGVHKIDWLNVSAQDPLGIFSFNGRVRTPSEVLVYPVPEPIPNVVLSGSEQYGSRDLPTATTRGSGIDPDGVREYVPGDPLRRMHWRSTARTGKLSVIEYEESHGLNATIVLDTQQGTDIGHGKETTFEYLARMAASVAQEAIRQGATIRLITGDVPDPATAPGRGSEHLLTVLAGLARAEANDSSRLSERLVARVGLLPAGSTLIVLTSSLDQDLPGALAHYTAVGVYTIVFFADSRSFAMTLRGHSRDARHAFAEGLLVSGVNAFVLRRNDQNQLRPEPIHNVRVLTDI